TSQEGSSERRLSSRSSCSRRGSNAGDLAYASPRERLIGSRALFGVFLAAGLGTRLRPLTLTLPKPAVPVANRPLASFAIEHLLRHGASEVRDSAQHLAAPLVDALGGHHGTSAPLRYFVEREILGTGGGLRAALLDANDD